MAERKYFCKWRGCRQLLTEAGYCPKHAPLVIAREEKKQREREDAFTKARRTNYGFYRTKRWRDLRNRLLRIYPQCARCGATSDLHVDHVLPPRGSEQLFFCEENLQVLCEACHREKTAYEIAGRKHKGKDKGVVAQWIRQYIRQKAK